MTCASILGLLFPLAGVPDQSLLLGRRTGLGGGLLKVNILIYDHTQYLSEGDIIMSVGHAPLERRELGKHATEKRIRSAARDLFAEHGIGVATAQQITDARMWPSVRVTPSRRRGSWSWSRTRGLPRPGDVLDALSEDRVGEFLVGEGAGELDRSDNHGEHAERAHRRRLRFVWC